MTEPPWKSMWTLTCVMFACTFIIVSYLITRVSELRKDITGLRNEVDALKSVVYEVHYTSSKSSCYELGVYTKDGIPVVVTAPSKAIQGQDIFTCVVDILPTLTKHQEVSK